MKKTVSRVMALLLASMLTLTGCGGSQETGEENTTSGEAGGTEQKEEASSENEIKDLVIPMADAVNWKPSTSCMHRNRG